MVEIREVKTRKDLRTFAGFNEKMYRDVPQAFPDLISDEMANFTPKKNPAFEYCESRQFLAYKDGECVGRIAGIISHKANDKWNRENIRFSRVDFIDDYEVSSALFKAVEDWGRERGLKAIHGPIGFCDLDQEGMLIEGFEYDGMFVTINNAPYYKDHMEKMGFGKATDWIEMRLDVPKEEPEFWKKLAERVVEENEFRVYQAPNRFALKKYIPQIFELINATYKELYGEVELSEAQVKKYTSQFILMVNVKYITMVFDKDDNMVGFGIVVPSMAHASKKSKGRLLPFGWFRMLRAPFSKPETVERFLVGALEKYQRLGVPAVLIHSMFAQAIKDGVKYAETGPMLEDNTKIHSVWKKFDKIQHRRRRCWIKEL